MSGVFNRRIVAAVFGLALLVSSVSHGGPSASNEAVVLGGRPLKYLGTALREYLFFDIYTLEAYSESGACAPNRIVYAPEAKMVRLTMHRYVPVNHLRWQVRKTFDQNLPRQGDTSGLKQKIGSFLALFKTDLAVGTAVEIAYLPGRGITVTQNGRPLGPPIPGRDFQELTWRSFFGNTCSGKRIVEQCLQAYR